MMDFIDLKQQQTLIRKNVDKRIARVLDHGQYIQGPEIYELEKELSLFSQSKFVLCCSSGTDALVLGLLALGLRPNDGVIVPSFTFASTAEAVCMLGGVPFFSDVKLDTYNICEESIINSINKAKEIGINFVPYPVDHRSILINGNNIINIYKDFDIGKNISMFNIFFREMLGILAFKLLY